MNFRAQCVEGIVVTYSRISLSNHGMTDERTLLPANSNFTNPAQGSANGRTLTRREFQRAPLSDNTFALDPQGRELGLVANVSGGGVMLHPATPWARETLAIGRHFAVTIVEPASGNKIQLNVEVSHITYPSRIGLRFL